MCDATDGKSGPSSSPPGAGRSSSKWQWPLATVCIVALLVGAGVLVYAIHAAKGIAKEFGQGQISHTFREEVTRIAAAKGLPLEVGTIETHVSLERRNERNVGWGRVYLGTTVTEIKVPAVFRYHILLKDEWRLDTHGNVVLVHAPRIHPTLPVAFDSSRMERRAERGWARLDTGKEMAELEKTVTEHLSKVAHTKVDLVRDKARETVAEFVKAWLVRNDHWCKDRFGVIKVVFANERERPFEELPATVSLE